jgi:hypothetical protein
MARLDGPRGRKAWRILGTLAVVLLLLGGTLCLQFPHAVVIRGSLDGEGTVTHARARASCTPRMPLPPFNAEVNLIDTGLFSRFGKDLDLPVALSAHGRSFELRFEDRWLSVGKIRCGHAGIELDLELPGRCLEWLIHIERHDQPGAPAVVVHPEAQKKLFETDKCPYGHSYVRVGNGAGRFDLGLIPVSVRPGVTEADLQREVQ